MTNTWVSTYVLMRRDDSVGTRISIGYEDGQPAVRLPTELKLVSFPLRPDLLCGPPNLLSNGDRGLFPRG
jgi:hypothetical protein